MNQGLSGVAIVGRNHRQGVQRFELQAFCGSLTRFTMTALVGNFVEPLARLRVDVGSIGERAQWPEVGSGITDGSLYFSFFPRRSHMTSAGKEAIFASEGQKTRMETHQVAVMFGDGGGKIIEPKLARDATHETECMDMTANKSLEALAVGELQIQLAAVTFHQTESVEFSRMPLIRKPVAVPPIDFEAFSRSRFHAHVGALGAGLQAHPMQVLLQDAPATADAERPEPLCDHPPPPIRILLQHLAHRGPHA